MSTSSSSIISFSWKNFRPDFQGLEDGWGDPMGGMADLAEVSVCHHIEASDESTSMFEPKFSIYIPQVALNLIQFLGPFKNGLSYRLFSSLGKVNY